MEYVVLGQGATVTGPVAQVERPTQGQERPARGQPGLVQPELLVLVQSIARSRPEARKHNEGAEPFIVH